MDERLREHEVVLSGPRLTLRPLTENDWDILLPWNQDLAVIYFADSDGSIPHTLAQVKDIYRWVSQTAFTFVMELQGRPIGECWLQQMNLPRLITRHSGEDLRRIDLMIGEKELWGKGLGSEAISLLTHFGFEQQRCDRIFACGVADYNPRSMGAFRKCGYRVSQVLAEQGPKMRFSYDLSLTRSTFSGNPQPPRVLNAVSDLAHGQLESRFGSQALFVHVPADQQVLERALPDFDVCLLDEVSNLASEMPDGVRLKRLITAPNPACVLEELRQFLEGRA
jgi:RimJ/RimL family protein N-acetyltransferase